VTSDNRSEVGLLYQKDPDSTNFPLTEIKRALKRFGRRADLAGLAPAVAVLNPAHAALVQPEALAELGLELQFNAKIGVGYVWLTGRPEPANTTVEPARVMVVHCSLPSQQVVQFSAVGNMGK
jgi:hypothetical protein